MARFDTRKIDSTVDDVSRLAGSFAHEVRNPLSTLNINAQLVLEDFPRPEGPREERLVRRLGVMREELTRVQQTIDSFLRLVKHDRIREARVDVSEIVRELESNMREVLERTGVRMLVQIEEGLEPVRGDAALIRQALLNLLRNAQSAMPDGGDLFVKARNVGDRIEVEVVDTGTGISDEALPTIFSPYVSHTVGGTGLGLPITLRIVRQHGGEIVVETERGQGSSFTVELPTYDASRAALSTRTEDPKS